MPQAPDRTVAFVDLAGFTALTEAHGDFEAADLAERFTDLARNALATGDQLVKAIGDAAMMTSLDPASGLRLVDRVDTGCHAAAGFPVPRSGLHHGPVVGRDRDFFGATVNLAARIAGQAAGGQTLGTAAIADAARTLGMGVDNIGLVELRNVSRPVELFQVRLGPADTGGAVDPVCRMQVTYATAAGRLHHAGIEYSGANVRNPVGRRGRGAAVRRGPAGQALRLGRLPTTAPA